MSGSHFIMQTSNFLLNHATVVALDQGHGKVIQYISTELYFIRLKYLDFSSNGFDIRGRGGNDLKTLMISLIPIFLLYTKLYMHF